MEGHYVCIRIKTIPYKHYTGFNEYGAPLPSGLNTCSLLPAYDASINQGQGRNSSEHDHDARTNTCWMSPLVMSFMSPLLSFNDGMMAERTTAWDPLSISRPHLYVIQGLLLSPHRLPSRKLPHKQPEHDYYRHHGSRFYSLYPSPSHFHGHGADHPHLGRR
jgi:hypothetical protein